MSGPIQTDDTEATGPSADPSRVPVLELRPSRETTIDGQSVRRALPQRGRRTVGAWCFADHIGPSSVDATTGLNIGPHPHIGLQTVTWLLSGEVLHRDSLGSEQLIRPGQLNLMTAGHGVAHSEEDPGSLNGEIHGIQFWIAQPEATRHGEPAFEHHPALPQVEIDGAQVTVLVGEFGGVESPARRDTDHVGIDLELRGGATLPLRAGYEYALIVLEGSVRIGSDVVVPGYLAYLGEGREVLALSAQEPARLVLLGGIPFESPILMWWNFVGRTREEIDAATASWQRDDGRFSPVASTLPRLEAPPTPWST